MKERILVVDDEKLIRWYIRENLEKKGYEVIEAEKGSEAIKAFSDSLPDTVLLDVNLPDLSGIDVLKALKEVDKDVPVIIVTAHGSVQTAVDAMRLGAYDFVEKPFEAEKLNIVVSKALENAYLRREVSRYRAITGDYRFEHIIGSSQAMKEVMNLVRKVALSGATTVLLEGESGTGKDFIAKVIHHQSNRSHKSFVEVNCAALPSNLIESELFGFERGAFTGANVMKKGLFEVAHTGTIYLDEIGDMNYDLQAKLLKVIDSKTFRRLGGTNEISIDVRIIAATNRDLQAKIKDGTFREDLYWRLKVIPLYLPPLRERGEDVLILSQQFIDRFNRDFKKQVKGLSPETSALFMSYSWPGNVRELRNIIERAMIIESSEYITPDHLPLEIVKYKPVEKVMPLSEGEAVLTIPDEGIDIEEVEKELIKKALAIAKGNQSKAARLLKLGRDAFRYRMQKFGLEADSKSES